MASLTDTDRTRLLFLLDALRVAPEKREALIAVVECGECSGVLREALESLRAAPDVRAAGDAMREAMR